MNARTVLAAFAVLVAVAMVGTALAAGTAKDPKTLVLQKSDFPAGARLGQKGADKNPHVSSYYVTFRYTAGSKQFELISTASVMSRGLATSAFREARSQLLQGYRKISLPKYGDEQAAGLAREDNAGELWVRKGGTMWAISVLGPITQADAVAQLKRYAPKQMRRVGSG
jgi:hypothetical protein